MVMYLNNILYNHIIGKVIIYEKLITIMYHNYLAYLDGPVRDQFVKKSNFN
jgi:hypothetical protein